MNRYREEEVSGVKRRCIQAPEHENLQNSPDWEEMPYTAAVQVFSYLRNKDRINMAQVCRKWHNSFKDPSLWSKKKLVFDGKLDHRHILFTSLFGGCIQKVRLEILYEAGNTCEIIAESFENVLQNLKAARLRYFELTDLCLEEFEMFPEQKNIIIRCLKEMFQSETSLKTVLISSSHFDTSSGAEIMDIMAIYAGNGLERLILYDYFPENFPVNDIEIFKETLTKFKNLKHISIHYSYISDEVLRHWAVSLHHKLESMEISAVSKEPHSHIITEETWRELSASCPKLKVKFVILDLPSVNQILTLLQPSVPLSNFVMNLDVNDSQLSVTLKHLADCYGHRLENLYLSYFKMNYSIDHELAYLIQRSGYKLQSFMFIGNFGIMVPDAILNLLNDRQSVLHTADISHFKKLDPEIEKKLKLIDALLPRKKFHVLNDDFDMYEDFPDVDEFMM